MNMITNKDAKLIYSRFWNKNVGEVLFPTIYIDEYWEYTIDLFNLRQNWEKFLNLFNEEFESAEQYINESENFLDIVVHELFENDAYEKVHSFEKNNYYFKKTPIYSLPDGEYWVIDLTCASMQCLKYIGAIKPNKTYSQVVDENTNYNLFKKSKDLRIQASLKICFYISNIVYNICDDLLFNVIQSDYFKNKFTFDDIVGRNKDSIYIPKNKANLTIGDYTINGIDIHIKSEKISSVIYKNHNIKYVDRKSLSSFYYESGLFAPIDEYLCIMKTIKNQPINSIDLSVGFEDQIFYLMDY